MQEFYEVHWGGEDTCMARLRNEDFDEFWFKERRLLPYSDPLVFDASEDTDVDYLCNYNCCRLCSDRLRMLIERARSQEDILQWLPARVITPNKVERSYSVLHFPAKLNVLDEDNTVRLGGDVLDPVFDLALLGARRILTWNSSLFGSCVDGLVHSEMTAKMITGVTFSPVRVTG